MRQIIRNHNRLAGFRFTLIEFLIGAAGLIGLALGFILVGRFPLALIAGGIALNCAAVAGATLADRGAEGPVRRWTAAFSPSDRAAILREHPHAQRDTWALAAITLVPLLVVFGLLLGRFPRVTRRR